MSLSSSHPLLRTLSFCLLVALTTPVIVSAQTPAEAPKKELSEKVTAIRSARLEQASKTFAAR